MKITNRVRLWISVSADIENYQFVRLSNEYYIVFSFLKAATIHYTVEISRQLRIVFYEQED